MIGDLRQHGAEVEFRIESVELGRADQGVHGSGALAATVRSGEQEVLSPKSDSSERPLSGTVIDLEQAVFGVAREGPPSRERIANRSCSLALRGQRAKRLLHPFAQLIEQRPGPRLPNTQPDVNWLPADLVFDYIKSADPCQRFGGGRRSMRQMDVVELAPGMRPTSRLIYMVAVEMMKSRISVGLQGSGEVLQMLPGMFS